MPWYEYHCPANGQTLEVRHGMDDALETWSELAQAAATEVGGTPPDAPVHRLMSTPVPTPGSANPGFQGCGSGCACVPNA